MGTFQVTIEIGDPPGRSWQRMDALVDSGSTYTWIPAEALHRLGVSSEGAEEFETATGSVIEREIGETRVRVEGRVRTTVVVFGDQGSMPLLGAVALESCGLAVDPVRRRLVPVRALAMGFS